ncbi:MAG: integrin alpha, partial [Candidatus Hodarchaeales archaeon]
ETPVAQAANASFIGETEDDHSGHGIYGVGDVNNDGYNDLLISGEWNDEGGRDSGQVYLILGRPTNQWTKDTQLPQGTNASFIGNTTIISLGFDAAGIGDVNKDSYTDFAIGALKNNDQTVNISYYLTEDEFPPTLPSRQVFIILGRPSHQWQMAQPISEANASLLFERWWGPSNDFISGVNDVNNDGFDDFLVGAYLDDSGGANAGQTYLYLGRPTKQWNTGTAIFQANASFRSDKPYDWSGWSVAGASDVNNDGYDDFLIGAVNDIWDPNNEGSVYLFFGRPTNQWQTNLQLSHADHSFSGENPGDAFGAHVAGVGDVNNDGFDDFMINAAGYDEWKGKVYLLLGNSILVPPTTNTTTAITTSSTNGTRAGFLAIIPVLTTLALLHKKQRKKR